MIIILKSAQKEVAKKQLQFRKDCNWSLKTILLHRKNIDDYLLHSINCEFSDLILNFSIHILPFSFNDDISYDSSLSLLPVHRFVVGLHTIYDCTIRQFGYVILALTTIASFSSCKASASCACGSTNNSTQ